MSGNDHSTDSDRPGDEADGDLARGPSDPISNLVRVFLNSNLSIVLILVAVAVGAAALLGTPREEDPQIVVPLADVYVSFPGHDAEEVERLVTTPLERMLYQIDGVEYVYSVSQDDAAVITVRFYVGQDRERSLVKLFKRLQENADSIPPGVAGWVMKPVEIDDVPIVSLTLTRPNSDGHDLRRLGEELVERLSIVPQVSRALVIGGEPRVVSVLLDADRLAAHRLSPTAVTAALRASNVILPAGDATKEDRRLTFVAGNGPIAPEDVAGLVIGVFDDRPVRLRDVAELTDGPAEIDSYVRHGWGPARGFGTHAGASGSVLGETHADPSHAENDEAATRPAAHDGDRASEPEVTPAVTLTISKQQGSNAVTVAQRVLQVAERLRTEVLPDDVQMIVTRNSGMVADEKVDELIEALGVAIVIVVLLLTLGLGWREALIVAIAVPVVFGLTLAVNLLAGYTINRVTLFALILSLGLLVDDPIVDVENIARHFAEKGRRTRRIVLDAVSEIRPPLISATLAVIVSFLPMFFITGMMGPYMSPMALNVPIAMAMSMLVAFTITPWLSYHLLRPHAGHAAPGAAAVTTTDGSGVDSGHAPPSQHHGLYDPEVVKRSLLYVIFRPMMAVLLKNRFNAVAFLVLILALTVAAAGLAATRSVPLKMLPFDNKNEWLLVIDLPENVSLERTDAAVRDLESVLAQVPEVTDFTSYVGVAGPIDFNGLVRHYALRELPHQAEVRVNFVGKRLRRQQSHGLALRLREQLEEIGRRHAALVRIVELPPGPPVLASLVAEIRGRPDMTYAELLAAANGVADRFRAEPGVAEVDVMDEVPLVRWFFDTDQEKAALAGVSVAEIAETIRMAVGGADDVTLRVANERQPLRVRVRLPRTQRSDPHDLSRLQVIGRNGEPVPISELGSWVQTESGQPIHHKNLQRVAYVLAECVGRAPAECVIDILVDQQEDGTATVDPNAESRAIAERTYLAPGGGVPWSMPVGTEVTFSGEGEWKITLDVFRDLGLAFGAAMVMIYVILVAQTGSFMVPVVVMLAIPLTVLGVMPGFWMLNLIAGSEVGGFADPVYFTATAMIGMIALSGIVTRDAIILVDFMELAVRSGRPLFDAILESRVVRLRPILLTAGAALLSSLPITLDPIFSGLGWSLIFGLIASTIFTLFVIPATYWLLKAGKS